MASDHGLPKRIGKYEIGELLGEGTCGTVHRAHDPFVGRDVAIKVAHRREAARMMQSGTARRTFFSEAHAAGQLTHPNIVAVHDAGMEGSYSYIVMEYVAGETLQQWGRKGSERLDPERVVDIAFHCCRALDYAHSRGIVHRDIKPSNVMLTPQGSVKIADFSIAVMTATQGSGRQAVEGTPNYMAPEQVRGEAVGAAADLYALGVLMYELLSGRVPFSDPDVTQLFERIGSTPAPSLAEVAPDVPDELVTIVDRLLRKKPGERFAARAEVAAALSRVHNRLRRSEQQLAKGEHRNLLRGLDFFSGFRDEDIDGLLEASTLLQFRSGQPIVEGGPDALRTNLPIPKWEQKLRQRGIPTRTSYHAGTVLCNAILYLSQYYAQRDQLRTKSTFIHLPLAPSQVAQGDNKMPSMSVPLMSAALAVVLEDIIGGEWHIA